MELNALGSYGADSSGMVCGFLFGPEGAKAVTAEEARDWLALPGHQPGFIWLHFNLAMAATERWLNTLPLPESFKHTLHTSSRSSRVELEGEALQAVLNDVLFDFSFDAAEISTLWLCLDCRMVISARSRPLRSIDRLRESVRTGARLRSPVELLVRLLSLQAGVLAQIVRDSAEEVDRIEDRLLADRLERRRVNLGSLRRVLVRLQRLLAPEPAALFRLLNRPPEWIAQEDIDDLRESTEEFSAVLSDLTALHERIKLLQEEIAAHMNEQDNRSLFMLTIVTVLALPFNIVAGLLGMNVGGIPLAQHAHGFWIIVTVVAGLTSAAGWWAWRKWRG
ncbi:transporter [Silvimonas amylolytica]|uniref:Magnesium transporter CorA n=1 Tax=Silvimonas amylolytica TaxID=449663 RepID=A0ABQ2PH46_9NEIS|nr:transporter [Silvimonas amylolytica]GGP24928.1 magnesium transporter CorA [Silvimonas amylolytica]